jgi:adenylylsulfate kinase-like enzyme
MTMPICWLNGAFGVGKSTTAKALEKQWPGSYRFDPEQIGFMLRKVIPRDCQTGDFQDLPLWREMTVATVTDLAQTCKRPIIIPMTIVVPQYFDEVVGELRRNNLDLHHFTLVGSRTTLNKRIRRRWLLPEAKRWVRAQMERCVSALESPEFAVHIQTDNRNVKEIVKEIRSQLPDV